MASTKKSPTPKNPTTPSAASRVQASQAKAGNDTGKGSFPARVQAAAATNVNKVDEPVSKGGRKSPSKGTRK
ncbi:hypothetical protein GGU11DRAFT_743599 [Lentinula aff. detonsa]|uniref:SMP domain-containing protein n=1 Tax=Lentinula aff. detonsa TaxID=2804958 RepID=A0AA38KWU4_9AGAR|nr:hypothetical protein GGU10DRAFT_374788 [Lentinula aff. detonsa]KAJ3799210.1 hypothetical protein GGU11DRAFT_743599 [Lentinula aff. detonsa]